MTQQQTTRNGNGHTATTPAPAPTFNEAPASINLRFNYKGFSSIQLTLRGESGSDLLTKLDTVLGRLETMGATPTGNERGGGGQQAAPATNGAPIPVCEFHGEMAPSKKFKGFYCRHKMGDGSYCKSERRD